MFQPAAGIRTQMQNESVVVIGNLPEHRSFILHLRRSEEHTSELQSRLHLVCRLLLEKKKKKLQPDVTASKKDSTTSRYCAVIPTYTASTAAISTQLLATRCMTHTNTHNHGTELTAAY